METQKLATELLREVKLQAKRWFALFLIASVMLVTSNIVWLYAWCSKAEETISEETILEADDSVSAIINTNGEVKVNGTNCKNGDNHSNKKKTKQTLSKKRVMLYGNF